MKNNITAIVFKKELIDIFRDKKTLILGVILPLFLFPIIFGVMGKSIEKSSKSVESNLKIAIKDSRNSSLSQFIKSQKNVVIVDSNNLDEDVKAGKIYVGIDIPDNFDQAVAREEGLKVKMVYDDVSQSSMQAFSTMNSFVDAYSKTVVKDRLDKRNINSEILNPVSLDVRTSTKEKGSKAQFMISLLLPLMLVIYAVTGPMAAATDLGAGEKERGTLEPLLTTQAGRLSLLWGKFFAITVMGVLTTTASLIGLYVGITKNQSVFGMEQGGSSGYVMSPKTIFMIALISILTTMVFGALELAISIYARSFKEAQTYLAPINILALVPVYATYMLDGKNIDNYYFHLPIANVSCLLKEFTLGIFNFNHIGITFAWILVYVVAAILFARYMFSKEEVIFRT